MRLTTRSDTVVPPAVGWAERRFPEEPRAARENRVARAHRAHRADPSAALRALPLPDVGPGR